MDDVWALVLGVAAALTFPVVVLVIHHRRTARHDRKMGSRRTDKIKL